MTSHLCMEKKSQNIVAMLFNLVIHLDAMRRFQLMGLLLLMLLTSIAEVIGVGALIPFLAFISSPDIVTRSPFFIRAIEYLGLGSRSNLLFHFTSFFLIATLLAGLMRVLLIWFNSKTAFEIGSDVSAKLYSNSLAQSYIFHLNTNSSNLINTVSHETNLVINNVILSVLTLTASLFLLVFLTFAMLLVNPFIAINAVIGFGLIYFGIGVLTKKRLRNNGEVISKNSAAGIRVLQEGFGGLRDVLVGGTQHAFTKIFRESDYKLRKSQGINLFVAQSPRYIMETLGMILVIVLAYMLTIKSDNDNAEIIPTLGFLALAAQRLLPALQQGYVAWTNLVASATPLYGVVSLLNMPVSKVYESPIRSPMPFKYFIELKDVCFTYPAQEAAALKNISLSIRKGERVGFIGSSGSGKSTLMDIILGLLEPSHGGVYIDGALLDDGSRRAWQLNVANVSQSIYLSDSSIEENIAFGFPVETIDKHRVYASAKAAQLSSMIEGLPYKYSTQVGERGVRFSGGQRQRIGVARALYKNANVIIFDEATSSLDIKTELAIIESIEALNPDITVLIIAHRLSTLRNCSRIVELNSGIVARIVQYRDIANS